MPFIYTFISFCQVTDERTCSYITITTSFLAFTSARSLNYSLHSSRRCTGPCGGDVRLICATVCFFWAAAVFSPPLPMRCANHRRIYCGADTFVEGVWGFWVKHMLNTEGGENTKQEELSLKGRLFCKNTLYQ